MKISLSFLVSIAYLTVCAHDLLQQPDVIEQYLTTFGYFYHNHRELHSANAHQQDVDNSPHVDNMSDIQLDDKKAAIMRLQEFFNVSKSGVLDPETTEIIKKPRCGAADLEYINSNSHLRITHDSSMYRRVSYLNNKWNKSRISWKITKPTNQLNHYDQRDTIRTALSLWAKYVPFDFFEIRDHTIPDIEITFERKQHGGPNHIGFDGKGNVLAHAWGPYPEATRGLSGDIHFDDDDEWNLKSLLITAVHEVGHSLGLVHTSDATDIMYPILLNNNLPVRIGKESITKLVHLYNDLVEGSDACCCCSS